MRCIVETAKNQLRLVIGESSVWKPHTILLDLLDTGGYDLCQPLEFYFTDATPTASAPSAEAVLHMLQVHAFVGRHLADLEVFPGRRNRFLFPEKVCVRNLISCSP